MLKVRFQRILKKKLLWLLEFMQRDDQVPQPGCREVGANLVGAQECKIVRRCLVGVRYLGREELGARSYFRR